MDGCVLLVVPCRVKGTFLNWYVCAPERDSDEVPTSSNVTRNFLSLI